MSKRELYLIILHYQIYKPELYIKLTIFEKTKLLTNDLS